MRRPGGAAAASAGGAAAPQAAHAAQLAAERTAADGGTGEGDRGNAKMEDTHTHIYI